MPGSGQASREETEGAKEGRTPRTPSRRTVFSSEANMTGVLSNLRSNLLLGRAVAVASEVSGWLRKGRWIAKVDGRLRALTLSEPSRRPVSAQQPNHTGTIAPVVEAAPLRAATWKLSIVG